MAAAAFGDLNCLVGVWLGGIKRGGSGGRPFDFVKKRRQEFATDQQQLAAQAQRQAEDEALLALFLLDGD